MKDKAKEGNGRIDGSGFVLIRTNNIVALYKKGNESLLGKVAWGINENSTLHLAKVLHQVPDILWIGNTESLYLVRLFQVLVFLVVSLAFLENSLLAIAVYYDGSLTLCHKIVGKHGA